MELSQVRARIDETLAAWLDVELGAAAPEIADPIRYAVLAPGKRIRPLLVIASWEAAGGPRGEDAPAALYRLACGPELIHAYSLTHDDLPCMDDDELRRGRPTVHVRFGRKPAILAGAALMPMAIRAVGGAALALNLGDELGSRLITELAVASGGSGMVGGQLLDLQAERVPVDDVALERIHVGKTARLISASCTVGGLAARAPSSTVERLSRYGELLGLAFQTVDDILDVTGSTQQMGKIGGRDQELGKATTPSVLGLEAARERAAQLGQRALEQIQPLTGVGGLLEIARVVLDRDR